MFSKPLSSPTTETADTAKYHTSPSPDSFQSFCVLNDESVVEPSSNQRVSLPRRPYTLYSPEVVGVHLTIVRLPTRSALTLISEGDSIVNGSATVGSSTKPIDVG